MNKEAILKTAHALRQSQPIDDIGFNMGIFYGDALLSDRTGHNCGTTACIAGWALATNGQRRALGRGLAIFDKAATLLGLSYNQASALFLGEDEFGTAPEFTCDWTQITPIYAAKVLEHLAETGEVRWDLYGNE